MFWQFKTNTIAASILQISTLIVSLLLVNQISNNKLTIGDYVALLGAVSNVQGLFATIGGHFGGIFETAIYNNSLLKILQFETTNKNSHRMLGSFEKLEISDISFSYPQSDHTVLNKINININQGEHVSIVGYNGSGKSTLINCILGLYHVNSGRILINGTDINLIEKETYNSLFSVVFQDFNKYKYSVRENIAFGNLSKLNNDDELLAILNKVELLDKIEKFEDRLDTYLTKEFKNGSELSGGEWQRIALARSFLRPSEIIILDEPTAALDPISEMKIFELFYKLAEGKTTITISHRLGPTKRSDRIIVLESGEIAEEGTFNELIDNKGLFYEMYSAQSKWYDKGEESYEE
ncbi:Heterocyst differentiation ATP-binding protein HepA [compost metagenome]